MRYKNLPTSAKVSIVFSTVQIIAGPLAEITYHVGRLDSAWPSDSIVTDYTFLASMILFVVLSLPNLCLVGWELLIALKTKEYFWLQYGLAAIVVGMWIWVLVTATTHSGV